MNILEKTLKILQQPVCDHCLGRQFGKLLSGYDNEERGRMLRAMAAMSIDEENSVINADTSNFLGFKFHNLEIKETLKRKKCSVCSDLFGSLDKWAGKVANKSRKYSFDTFLVGTKLSSEMVNREEDLWERVGIDYCEPLKAETNREVGKAVEKKLSKKFSLRPDVNFILDMENGSVDVLVNPIFIYGEYQKLVRGIPQTRWPSGKYKTSVEQIIAKPFMKATKGKGHKLHGQGREDIDARCLAWRPFVLEILEPRTRKLDLKKLAKKIEKKVRARKLRLSGIGEVREIKEAKADKTYRAMVLCSKPVSRSDLKRLSSLSQINQRTPQRVLHRRADKYRKRKVIKIKTKFINSRKFSLIVRGEAGLYIKELVSGDNGRTKPSISEILNNECSCRDLDVITIHAKK